jgi:hypothetical protein
VRLGSIVVVVVVRHDLAPSGKRLDRRFCY